MSFKKVIVNVVLMILVLVALISATIITFRFVVFSDVSDLDGMYDAYRYFGPITYFLDYAIQSGELPLWNPMTYCGMPNTGNPQSFLFYVPHLVRALLTLNPTPERSNISLAIMWGMHLIFMAFCTYLLGRAHKLSFWGALTSAVAFAFSALMVRRMGEYHFITSMAWIPLLLLLIKKLIDTEDFFSKIGIAVFAGLTFGMSITGGFLQIANLLGFVPALYAFFYFLLNANWKQRNTSVYEWMRPWLHNGIAMAVVFVLGAGYAAVTLLPAWELGSFSLRSILAPSGKFSDLWKWSPLDFYQKMVLYCGIKYEAETIRNSGIIALVLAGAAFTHRNRRDVLLFAGLYLILFECCFGPPLPIGAFLEKITPFQLSAYSRAYDFALLPLSLLAGFGVDAIGRPLESRGHNYARAVIMLLLAFICLAPMGEWIKTITYVHVNNDARLIPLVAIALMLFTGIFKMNKAGQIIVGALMVILVFSETFAWNQSFVPYLTRRKVTDVVEVKQEGNAIPTTNFRETDPICNRLLYSLRFAMNGVDPAHLADVRNLLSGPPREGPGLRGVKDFEPTQKNLRGNMLFKRSFWLAHQYVVGTLPGKREYFPTATTVFLENPIDALIPQVQRQQLPLSSISENALVTDITAPDTLFAPVAAGQKRTLTFSTEVPEAVPGLPPGSAGAVHSALVYFYKSDANAQIDVTFTMPGTDLSEMGIQHTVRPTRDREAQLEVPLPDYSKIDAKIMVENKGQGNFTFTRMQIKSDLNDEDGLIRIQSRTANTVDLQVGPLPKPRILTFLDSWYPGWTAYVDGQEVSVLRADEQFKAVVLPEGTHDVRFVFKPTLTYIAFAISTAALAVSLILLFIAWYYRLPGVSPKAEGAFSIEIIYHPNNQAQTGNIAPETNINSDAELLN